EQRDLAVAGNLDRRNRHAGRRGVAGSGRDHDPPQDGALFGRGRGHGVTVDRVVADDPDRRPGGLERLDEVEREGVVVVDDEDHGTGSIVASDGPGRPAPASAPAASSIARRSAAALCSVSSNSRSGTLAATIPAPVWTWAWPPRSTAERIVIAVSRLPS